MALYVHCAGEFIARQGDLGDHLYFITAGKVDAVLPNGVTVFGEWQHAFCRVVPHHSRMPQPTPTQAPSTCLPLSAVTYKPGAFFGEHEMLHMTRRDASFRAVDFVDVLVLQRADFTELYISSPDFVREIQKADVARQQQRLDFELSVTGNTIVSGAAKPAAAAHRADGGWLSGSGGTAGGSRLPRAGGFTGSGDSTTASRSSQLDGGSGHAAARSRSTAPASPTHASLATVTEATHALDGRLVQQPTTHATTDVTNPQAAIPPLASHAATQPESLLGSTTAVPTSAPLASGHLLQRLGNLMSLAFARVHGRNRVVPATQPKAAASASPAVTPTNRDTAHRATPVVATGQWYANLGVLNKWLGVPATTAAAEDAALERHLGLQRPARARKPAGASSHRPSASPYHWGSRADRGDSADSLDSDDDTDLRTVVAMQPHTPRILVAEGSVAVSSRMGRRPRSRHEPPGMTAAVSPASARRARSRGQPSSFRSSDAATGGPSIGQPSLSLTSMGTRGKMSTVVDNIETVTRGRSRLSLSRSTRVGSAKRVPPPLADDLLTTLPALASRGSQRRLSGSSAVDAPMVAPKRSRVEIPVATAHPGRTSAAQPAGRINAAGAMRHLASTIHATRGRSVAGVAPPPSPAAPNGHVAALSTPALAKGTRLPPIRVAPPARHGDA